MAAWLYSALLIAVLLYGVVIYNSLVNLHHAVDKAWSNIDVLLKQRHDELPKLVETCKQYMQFERETLEKVMQARAALNTAREQGDVRAVGNAEAQMRLGFGSIVATSEAYPELRSNQAIQQLLARITGLENAITDRREFYNEYVNANNVRIEQIPDVIVARLGGFKTEALLEFSAEETRDVDVRALFRG
jgi:LemA protein